MQGILQSVTDFQDDGSPARLPLEDGVICDTGIRSGDFMSTVWLPVTWDAEVWSPAIYGHGRVW